MRIEWAIDAFLDWRRLERDATPRSVYSYWRILVKLAEDFPEVDIAALTTADLRQFLNRWKDRSASTRSNVISVVHSFFRWADEEDLIELDPSRKIRRPPKRKPDVYRPSLQELARLRAAALVHELPSILLMEGAGLRRSEVLGRVWDDLDLDRAQVRVERKGRHWLGYPLIRTSAAPSSGAGMSSSRSRMIMCSSYKSSSGRRQTSGSVAGKTLRSRRASRPFGGWFSVFAGGPGSAICPRISFGTASPTDSCGRAVETSSRSRD
jgi:integrase